MLFAFFLVRGLYGKIAAPPWDCGFPRRPRACRFGGGFDQPIRQIFEPFYRMRRELPSSFDAAPRYRVDVEDPMWSWIYLTIARATDRASRMVGMLQRGRISIYLLYSFVTLVALLFLTQA